MSRQREYQSPIVADGSLLYLRVGKEWFFYDQAERPLGAGAMGTVYTGRSCQTNEPVAIKRVVDRYANIPAIRERAKLEASLLFRHRNLVEMIGYCELHPYEGPIFIISRLVQGMTLDEHVEKFLKQRPDAVKRICETVYPVLDALEYLHSKGIVHMDIKPSNIMVENGCNIRLMDLGIATTHSDLGISSSGMVGTPKYAAPEQIYEEGQPQAKIEASTDIYEMGITLYELLSGFNPFDSDSREETIQRQRTLVLPVSANIPSPILGVLRKATEKAQADRYQSAAEFKAALRQALLKSAEKSKKTGWIIAGAAAAIILIVIMLLSL